MARPADLADKIARAIAPIAWAEFDAGKGVCSNSSGWACMASVDAAGKVLALLVAEGIIPPETPAQECDLDRSSL